MAGAQCSPWPWGLAEYGKSRVAVGLAQGASRTLVICPLSVVQVWPREFDKHAPAGSRVVAALDQGSVARKAADAETARYRAAERGEPLVVIVNYDSARMDPLAKWLLAQQWDLVVLDECHPAGTMIDTPDGQRAIETVRVGDHVWGVDHLSGYVVETEVRHTFNRESSEPLVQIGRTRMTPQHPVWTSRGYVPAQEVGPFDTVCYTVSNALEETVPAHLQMVPEPVLGRSSGSSVLRETMLFTIPMDRSGEESGAEQQDATTTRTPRGGSEDCRVSGIGEESITVAGSAATSTRRTPPAGVRRVERREWTGDDSSSTGASGGPGVADGIRGADGCGLSAASLQDRYRATRIVDRDRGRRDKSQGDRCPGSGSTEGRVSPRVGVGSAEVHERAGNEGTGVSAPSRRVYNIETGTGNYLADGLLVHNSHKVKAPGGKTSLFVARLRARRRVALTGTPMPHSPLDLYAQYRFVDPGVFGTSFVRYRNRYAVMGGYMQHQVVGWRDMDDLNARFYSRAYRADRSVIELPDAVHVERYGRLEGAARSIYEDLERELYAEWEGGSLSAANALVKLLRLAQLVGGWLTDESGGYHHLSTAKQSMLRDALEDFGDEPAVVVCRFQRDLDAVHEAAAQLKLRSSELSGRRRELQAWQDGETQVLAVQIQAGGVGIDLTRARFMVLYSVGFSLGDFDQVLARVHRPGQHRPVTYVHLIIEGTIDETIRKALDERADLVESALRRRNPMSYTN